MRIAVIGGGAAGMATAHWLNKQGHHVTIFERQPILGGHIRTLNKNVKPSNFVCNKVLCHEILESGPLEFPTTFHNFVAFMKELEVELVPVNIGSELFPKEGSPFLSEVAVEKNFTGIKRLIEFLRFNAIHIRSAGLWLKAQFSDLEDFYDQPLSHYLKDDSTGSLWLKLLTMYSYSIPFELIDNVPAELAIPMLRDYLAVKWLRVEGGVYTYIEKILDRFQGDVVLGVEITNISRCPDAIKIELSGGALQEFCKVVFATPPDQVMALLADPTDVEIKRFSAWQANYIKTTVHTDTSMYDNYGIRQPSEFDFFQTDTQWGYNGCLNQLCGISSPQHHFLSFQLEELIAKDRIVHIQEHHTPLYTTEAFRYRDEIVATNGENNTYHAGAYLGDGLHEGAITSALRVAQLIG
ncbi:FAD-dependent oxidoreductase [Nodosilinea sp. LEGE 07088]|uniref:FAD-dependent oxidoreductase n=1 Tax=Nodosilinea sp. LEGE 07088 TaxID=2777968 RepID=UPI00187FF0F5|nr:FAD-dependent oxidoreductase [Nodosilinea sp. LEGE 07088]MBE9135691.1 FAD-dependent oxidoreductase [Nodosilinea sp. LEGE 07088]